MLLRGAVPLICLLLPTLAAAYVRFSDTFLGTPVTCSEEEKFCFRYNLLYNDKSARCAPLFSHCSTDEDELVVDKEELTGPEPKLKARCGGARCPRHLESYFWPRGECLEPAGADVKCVGSSRTLNMFGEWECWCPDGANANATANASAPAAAAATASPCPAPVTRPQPPEVGRCLVPDLYEPYARHNATPAAAGPCSEEEFHCYNRSQVFLQGRCVAPLERGPCAEGEWVVLVPGAPPQAACAPRRCPDALHDVWMDGASLRVDPQCQPKEAVARLLCQDSEELVIDAFGNGKCNRRGCTPLFELPNARENGLCLVTNTCPFPANLEFSVSPVPSDAPPAVPPAPLQPSTPPSLLPQVVVSSESSTPFPVVVSPESSTPFPVVVSQESSTPFPVVVSPESSTPFPVVVSPESSTPFPVVVSPESSTPLSVAVIPETSTPSPVTSTSSPVETNSDVSTTSPDVKFPSSSADVTQQLSIDAQPCVNQPCVVSPAILPPPNTPQALSPEVVAVSTELGSIEISTPPSRRISTSDETAQVNQDQVFASQLDSQLPVATPAEITIPSQPPSIIIQTPSTELVAPDVSAPEQQLISGEPVISSAAINGSPTSLQNQTNSEVAPPVEVPGNVAASNPADQSISTLGNQDTTQQLVGQPQLVSSAALNSQTDKTIQTLPSIIAEPGVSVVAAQNVLLGEGVPATLATAPTIPPILEQDQSRIFDRPQQHTPFNVPTISVPSANVDSSISIQPDNVIVPLLPQQRVNGNVPFRAVQIVPNIPSDSSIHSTNGSPLVSVQSGSGNVPVVSLQPEQNYHSSGIVQSVTGQVNLSPVQTRQGDVVVDYVLLGQSNVPVNSV